MTKVTDNIGKISLPFIVLQGSQDKIVDPAGEKMLYEQAGSTDKTIKMYEEFYHEIHNEPERDKEFKDLEAWLSAHL